MTPRRGKDLGATGSLLPVPSRRTGDLFASCTLPTRENTKATCFRGWCQVRHNSLLDTVADRERSQRASLIPSALQNIPDVLFAALEELKRQAAWHRGREALA